jgi:S1-C subfamily serine protease
VLIAGVTAAAVSTIVVLNRRGPDQVGRGPLATGGQGNGSLTAVQAASPSVVRVERAVAATPATAATPDRSALGGTGVIVDARGYVLTAESLVAGAQGLTVAVPGGKTVPATVVGSDPLNAITLLKIEGSGLHALSSAGAAALDSGAGVVVLAAPPYLQVAVGAIASAHASATINDPSDPTRKRSLNDLLALDVASRDGQLGAPLLDGSGRLAGMVVATGAQLYAVDMSMAAADVQQLVDSGRVSYPTLGFDYRQLSVTEAADRGVPGGVEVLQLPPGSPAAVAGVARGDVVISANGTTLDPTHPLQRLLRGLAVRQGVSLVLKSAAGRRTLTVDVQLVST